MTASTDLPRLPFARRDNFDVPADYRALRAEGPITRVRTQTGDPAWLVTGYEEIRRLLADDRLGRSHPDPGRAARVSNSALFGGPRDEFATEKAAHEQMRRLLVPAFSRRRMNALRGRVESIVDELLDQMAERTPPVDLHEALSFPLPALVICELLGVPYEDRDYFRALSGQAAGVTDAAASAAAIEELNEYMRRLIAVKRADPAEDVLSDLVAAADGGLEDLDDDRIATLAGGLLIAGHETTVARIDYGTVLLLTHPDQLDALRRDPELVPTAVEEIMRASAPSDHGLPRYARTDIEVGDVTIRAGDAVVLLHFAANRDERTFPDPDRFDIFRAPADLHLGFGYGQHFCIGAGLARIELQAAFGALFRRFPTLALAVPVERLRRLTQRLTGGFVEVPVTWD
ncbi:MAG TPA: cytochrome P450 [Streptosporangiaceae bacterium]|nr:cytochrome P450 [Streptosporangiaceae bacterium]